MQVKADDLVVGYGKYSILSPITFDLPLGSSCLVVGPNGAGKSTLLRTIVGLQAALSGSIHIDGGLVTPGALRNLVPGAVRFLGQGDRGFRLLREADYQQVLPRLFGFQTNAANLRSGKTNRRIGSMSLGQRRLEALRLLDCEPAQLFILDEPTAGLDPKNRLFVKDWMQEATGRGKSFLVVEHDYRFFSGVFDKLMVIKSPNVIYFGDMLPNDDIIRLIS